MKRYIAAEARMKSVRGEQRVRKEILYMALTG